MSASRPLSRCTLLAGLGATASGYSPPAIESLTTEHPDLLRNSEHQARHQRRAGRRTHRVSGLHRASGRAGVAVRGFARPCHVTTSVSSRSTSRHSLLNDAEFLRAICMSNTALSAA